MPIASIDLFVIALYLLAMVAIGFLVARRVRGGADFALAGQSLSFPVLVGTLIGTVIGGVATMGNAGKAYQVGYAVLIATSSYFFGYLLLAVIAPRLRRAGITSMPEVLGRRYGVGMRLVGSLVILATMMMIFIAQLIAFGVVASMVLASIGLSYQEAVLIGAVVIVLYTLVGGLLAVAYTDMLQGVVMIIGIGLLLPLFLVLDLGGIDLTLELLQSNRDDWLGGMDLGYVLALIPAFMAAVVIDPTAWQRIAAARSAAMLRPALLATAAIYLVWTLLVVALGVLAHNLYPDLSSGDNVIPTMIFAHMPVVAKGICLAAILAILMSSADTVLLVCGTTASMDVARVLYPACDDRAQLTINRAVILFIGVLGTLVALAKVPLFEMNVIALGVFVSGLFVPVLAALFVKQVTGIAAALAGVSGAGSVIVCHLVKWGLDVTLPVEPILIGLGISSITLLFFSRLTYSASSATPPILRPQCSERADLPSPLETA